MRFNTSNQTTGPRRRRWIRVCARRPAVERTNMLTRRRRSDSTARWRRLNALAPQLLKLAVLKADVEVRLGDLRVYDVLNVVTLRFSWRRHRRLLVVP